MVNFKDISVVVQGSVNKNLIDKCLKSIRNNLPDAEIILSTWEGSKVDNLDYDFLVLSQDPGSFPCDDLENSIQNNINRQIVSTRAGLDKVTRPYAIKMRTDFIIESSQFLENFGNFPEKNKYSFLSEKVLACTTYSRNPRYTFNMFRMSLCPSDFFFFGYTEDLKKIFQIDIITSEEDKCYFRLNSDRKKERSYPHGLCRFMPEQFLWISFLKKYISHVECDHRDHITSNNIILTEKTLAGNLILLSKEQLGIESINSNLFTKGGPENCYTNDEWKLLYKIHCKGEHVAQFKYLFLVYCKNLKHKSKISFLLKKLSEKKDSLMIPKIKSLLDFPKYSKKYSHISLDIFDTILFRHTEPNWRPTSQAGFYAMIRSRFILPLITDRNFDDLRNKLIYEHHQNNVKNDLDHEYDFRDIVKRILNHYTKDEDQLKTLENDIVHNEKIRELGTLYVNPETIKMLEQLKQGGKTIVATSDMYLPQDILESILEQLKIRHYFDKVFVSSKTKKLKSSGKLFKHILEELKINKENLIHLGDTIHSDILPAKKMSIAVVHYKNPNNIKRRQKIGQMTSKPKLMSQFIKKCFAHTFSSQCNDFESYVRNYVALDINNFVYQIILQSKIDGIEALYFMERDGNIFKEIYDELFDRINLLHKVPKPKTELLRLSRKDTACLINIENSGDVILRSYNVNPPEYFSATHVLGCFGVKDIPEDIAKKDQDRSYFFSVYNEKILPLLHNRREKVLAILKDKGILENQKIGIVDIGWGGTSQSDIHTYLTKNHPNKTCTGYYFGVDSRMPRHLSNYGYCRAESLFFGYSLMEFLIKFYPDYTDDSRLKKTYAYNRISRDIIRKYTKEYASVVNKYCILPFDIAGYSQSKLRKMIQYPSRALANELSGILFSLDRKVGDDYLELAPKIKNKKERNKLKQSAQWLQAAEVRSGFIPRNKKGILRKLRGLYAVIPEDLYFLYKKASSFFIKAK